MPSLTQLEYIVAVGRTGHFARAADECHVSQPSLSMQIQKVEDELGLIIFDRNKKPIIPTARGLVLIEHAKVVLREQQKLINSVKVEKGEVSGDFRLGIIPTLAPYLLPLFISHFSKKFPHVHLKIDELKTDDIIQQIRDDRLQGGILATPLHEKGIKEAPLFYEKFYLYMRPNHPLASQKLIHVNDLDGGQMWLLQDGHCLRTQVVRLCSIKEPMGIFRNVEFEGGNLETLRYLVRQSQGYTLLPELFINTLSEGERKSSVRAFETPSPTREVSMVYHHQQWRLDIIHAISESVVENLPKGLNPQLEKDKVKIIKI